MITEKNTPENNHDDLGMEVHRTESSLESTFEGPENTSSSPRKVKASKVRRARRKAYRPYYQLSEAERIMREERERLRVEKLMERMRAKRRAIGPHNTTQFLMADHPDDTIKLLELLERPTERLMAKATVPDEEDFYYSSPSDEEDFMSKEFNNDYEKQHVTNLEMMSKEMLLNEYMIIKKKNETLEERLDGIQEKENGTTKELDGAQQLSNMKDEMEILRQENQKLFRSNSEIKEMLNISSDSYINLSDDEESYTYNEGSTPLNDTGYESNHHI
eukprot:GFUD01026849.1.p1 GENE.GFUD01026849.1~~GFUD01026849.1.p1  ORF type:complete len:275 (+),score=85.24 GFUD01026849.1:193-1017(+)